MLTPAIIEKYLLQDNLSTYDPYDIWKTNIGLKVKQLYYRNTYLGILPAGLLTLVDLYLNNSMRLGYTKQEYPIVRAQACLALLNLYRHDKQEKYLEYAKKHIDWLLANSAKGYSGHCWGTGFKIVISDTLIYDENTPFSTNTPYILEALYAYYQITKQDNILTILQSIYRFYENDLVILEENEEMLITSYGPFKDRVVTNAVSYTMFAYSIFYNLFEEKTYIKNKIEKMLHFIVSVQQEDGSWLYAPDSENSFIDCFHSAFILKNIIKTVKNVTIEYNQNFINKGYIYIHNNFYHPHYHLFRRFSLANKPSLIKFDLYDNAEMLYLSKLLGDTVLEKALEKSIEKYFHKKEDIFSVIEIVGMKKNKNTLRWAVMPYLLARSL